MFVGRSGIPIRSKITSRSWKRGIVGTFHHVSQQHLKRYLAEFDYRYNQRQGLGISDAERMARSIGGIVGKRLTYRRTGGREQADQPIPF
jgi:hypothetical protein